jgi:hypothetical protein
MTECVVWLMVMLWWLIVCTKKSIQDEDVQIGKISKYPSPVCEQGILHLMLPAGDD